ncbi:unnamed protein product [Leptidea sinapis]|uniref:Uncharacterized protein n=1 Tax=Leptidea sinapis TaxID=189913 RepID=A0A5E4QP23_9NEOP|nr:unnamed protein product [Leptidea sinapis]
MMTMDRTQNLIPITRNTSEFARPGHKIRLKKPSPESSDRTIGILSAQGLYEDVPGQLRHAKTFAHARPKGACVRRMRWCTRVRSRSRRMSESIPATDRTSVPSMVATRSSLRAPTSSPTYSPMPKRNQEILSPAPRSTTTTQRGQPHSLYNWRCHQTTPTLS